MTLETLRGGGELVTQKHFVNLYVVEKSSKYHTIKNLVLSFLELIDSDRVPIKPTDWNNISSADGSNSARNTSSFVASRQSTQDTGFASNGSGNGISSIESQQQNSDHHHTEPHHKLTIAPTIQQQDSTTSASSFSDRSSPITAPIQHQIMMHQKEATEQKQEQEVMDENTNYAELISRCLLKCGENEALLPLFRDLSIDLGRIGNSSHTKHIDGRARDILLIGVIVRMVQHLSQFVRIFIICDDIQCK